MFMVYWTAVEDDRYTPHCQLFESSRMVDALAFMEGLRKRRRDGENLQFVSMSSENPDHVGQMGVDTVGADYNWKKRRR